jgi:hypothetical protein
VCVGSSQPKKQPSQSTVASFFPCHDCLPRQERRARVGKAQQAKTVGGIDAGDSGQERGGEVGKAPLPRPVGDINGSGSGGYRGGAADGWLCMNSAKPCSDPGPHRYGLAILP